MKIAEKYLDNNYKKQFLEDNQVVNELSIEEYLYGYVNFCLTFGIKLNNKKLEEVLDYYTKTKLELEDYVTVNDNDIRR